MFRRSTDLNITPHLLLLMGQLLPIINATQPIPESDWFVEEFGKLQALTSKRATVQKLQRIASMIQTALQRSTYADVEKELRQAIFHLQKMTGTKETGIIIDDPQWIGKQVVPRQQKENTIVYGHIESTVVFVDGNTVFDTWVVNVRPGFMLQAGSEDVVLYDGPQFQPGERVVYEERERPIEATILGPGFGLRGCFGFNLSFQRSGKEEYRYAVPYTKLSSEK